MCRAITCSKCQKASWAGCGAHVEQVLGGVPQSQRCTCREDKAAAKAASRTAAPDGGPGFFAKLLNR